MVPLSRNSYIGVIYIGETVIFLKKLRGNICEIFDFRH